MIPEITNMSQPSVGGMVLLSALVVLLLSSNDLEAKTENTNQTSIILEKGDSLFLSCLTNSMSHFPVQITNRKNMRAS